MVKVLECGTECERNTKETCGKKKKGVSEKRNTLEEVGAAVNFVQI